jgi:uncharacterized protein YjbJ (UPF0337 family)
LVSKAWPSPRATASTVLSEANRRQPDLLKLNFGQRGPLSGLYVPKNTRLPVSQWHSAGRLFVEPDTEVNMDREKIEEYKGRIKEAAGDLTDDDELQREGKIEQAAAKVKQEVQDLGEGVAEFVDKAASELKERVGK